MNEDCPICYDPFEPNGNNVSKTSCEHQFHTNCILQIRNGTCPICRNRLVHNNNEVVNNNNNEVDDRVRQNDEYNRIMEEADELIRIHREEREFERILRDRQRQLDRERRQIEIEYKAELRKLELERKQKEDKYKEELRLRELELKIKQREYNNRTYFASTTVHSDHSVDSDGFYNITTVKSINGSIKKEIKRKKIIVGSIDNSMNKIRNTPIRLIDQ